MGSVIKMYGAGTGGAQDAIASLDVPMSGALVGVDWAVRGTLGADFNLDVQISFRSVGSFATNDDRGIISEVRVNHDFTTSGGAVIGLNKYVQIPDLGVMGGERIYLHVTATASVSAAIAAMLHFDFDMEKASVRRR